MRNRNIRLAVLAALSSAAALSGTPAFAGDIATDGTLPGTTASALSSLNGSYAITQSLGVRAGTNLFHSFEVFNLDAGETAEFSGSADITNIVSRVTGGIPTTIDGTIRSTIQGASFWMVNPAGLTVGPSGAIDVSGAVALGAADSITFGEGMQFFALPDGADTAVGLLVSSPTDFGFLSDSVTGELRIENGAVLARTTLVAEDQQIQPLEDNPTLQKFSLLLSGGAGVFVGSEGDLDLADARVRAGNGSFSGPIELTAMGSIDITGSDLRTAASSDSGAGIFIQAGELVTISRSALVAQSIDKDVTSGDVTVVGTGVLINDQSLLATDFRSASGGVDELGAGTVRIVATGVSTETAPQLQLTNASEGVIRIVDSSIVANNEGGRPVGLTESVVIGTGGFLSNPEEPDFPTFPFPGDPEPTEPEPMLAGATHVVIAGSRISTDASAGGVAANIGIGADQGVWIIDSPTGVSSTISARADATAQFSGEISVLAGDAGLTVNGALIDASNAAQGTLDVGFQYNTGISLDTSGLLSLTGSTVRTDTNDGFDAGDISLQGDRVVLNDSTLDSSISLLDPSMRVAQIFGINEAGRIRVQAGEFLDDTGEPVPSRGLTLSITNSTLRASSNNDGLPGIDPIGGDADSIEVSSFDGLVQVRDSTFESNATGLNGGAPGAISVVGLELEVADSSFSVASESQSPDAVLAGGSESRAIGLAAGTRLLVSNSTLTATTSGTQRAGSVFIGGANVEINGSTLQASTTGTGNAGSIDFLVSDGLFFEIDPEDSTRIPFFDPSTFFLRIVDSTLTTSTGEVPSQAGSITAFVDGRIDIINSDLNINVTARLEPDIDFDDRFSDGNIQFFSGLAPINIIDSTLQANTTGLVNGGSIDLQAGSFVIRGSSITASSSATDPDLDMSGSSFPLDPRASAGSISLGLELSPFTPTDPDEEIPEGEVLPPLVSLLRPYIIESSTIATNAVATNGGDIAIFGRSVALSLTDSKILASAGGPGRGGDIELSGFSQVALVNSQVQAVAEAGAGGTIEVLLGPVVSFLDAGGPLLLDNSSIATNATAADGGDIFLDTLGQQVVLRDSSIVASAGGTGAGGDITILGANGATLANSQIQALASAGVGGTISITLMEGASNSVQLSNSQIAANATASDGGDISLDANGRSVLLEGSSIVASAGGTGIGGDISILDAASALLSDSQIQASTEAGAGGTITLGITSGSRGGVAFINTDVTTNATAAQGGSILVDAAGNHVVIQGSSMVASAGGTGMGGDISIVNAGGATLQNSQIQALADAGRGGTITLDIAAGVRAPVVIDGTSIRTNARNADGGSIALHANDNQVSLRDASIVASAGGTGRGGGIAIANAGGVAIQRSQIQSLADAGTGGTINIDLTDGVVGAASIEDSSITTNAMNASGGSIMFNAVGHQVSVTRSSLVASAGGSGTGGGISVINATAATIKDSQFQALANAGAGGTINFTLGAEASGPMVFDNTSITTNAASANGGSIAIDAAGQQVKLRGTSLVASAGGSGIGGGISIANANGATLEDTQFQALANAGAGGTISLQLTGAGGPLLFDNSSITTNAMAANGGNIAIDAAGHQVMMRNASIVASAGGNGRGGDISIVNAGGATLQNSKIQALANAGAGGTISLSLTDDVVAPLVLQSSSITTNAVAAGGGNISLDAAGNPLLMRDSTVLASAGAAGTGGNVLIDNVGRTLMQRSQVLARADAGNGGTITINVKDGALFVRDAQSLISADSNSGNNGSIDINSPDTDLNPAVKPQDATISSPPELSASACAPVASGARSTFVRESRGGIAASPDGYLASLNTGAREAERTAAALESENIRVAMADSHVATASCN